MHLKVRNMDFPICKAALTFGQCLLTPIHASAFDQTRDAFKPRGTENIKTHVVVDTHQHPHTCHPQHCSQKHAESRLKHCTLQSLFHFPMYKEILKDTVIAPSRAIAHMTPVRVIRWPQVSSTDGQITGQMSACI